MTHHASFTAIAAVIPRMPVAVVFPTGADRLSGMRFIDAVVRSSAAGAQWVGL
jgi:hypothetical protein